MSDTLRSSAQLPPEYCLTLVETATIDQSLASHETYDTTLVELTNTNTDLIAWVRAEATKSFPDDMNARKRAFGLAIGALGLVGQQQLKDVLLRRFGE